MLIKYKLFYTILHTSYDFYCFSECAYNWVKQFMWKKFNPIYFIGQLSPNGLFTVVNETWYCLRRKGQKLNGNDNRHCCSNRCLGASPGHPILLFPKESKKEDQCYKEREF